MKDALDNMEDFVYCFLDEKWFYTTSRRKKMKILPRATWEAEVEAKIVLPKVHSRKHTSKGMVMGIIGPPVYDKNEKIMFDGKIMAKQVSQQTSQINKICY